MFCQKWTVFVQFSFFQKISWKFHFSGKWLYPCILRQSLRKETYLKIQFYYRDNITQPKNICSKVWQQHWFDFGLIFILFLAIWLYLFAAPFSNCYKSSNFEAKINFNTSKVKFPKYREQNAQV